MKAICWAGRNAVEVADVPDPAILTARDAIVRVTATSICGSDLHLYDGYIPTVRKGDVLGHEFMGEVVDVGAQVRDLRVGDRVVVPFPIACGHCWACEHDLYSVCENSNPNAALAETFMGHGLAGIFGYSHMLGGYAGGQAEYVRVPFADVGPIRVEDDLADEQVLFLSDVLPTGWMAAENCDIRPGDTIAVWGAGPVGQFAAASAFIQGAERVIVIDRVPARLDRTRAYTGAETLDHEDVDVLDALRDMTAGRGPDACVDAVGMEAHHPTGPIHAFDRAKQALRRATERPHALREAIMACRGGGTVSVVGVYGGAIDTFPMGPLMNRSLTLRAGQCHVQRYLAPLLDRIRDGEIDPSFVVSHRMSLDEAPRGYELLKHERDKCNKIILRP
ncbi:zinc-dependent alcohol dehydrogenase [Streptomyces radicis]|uniref:Glutathione-dependent formaldehyde dehydrogenase n=1 Tax=Streptomyces radicis TaxID=1750517 RepID=A0A3A9WH08_9ACTN|nr:zinc-dependent alcohol dehydrogenase [Streptomyces radicis]RKN12511.1 glutathione-dependent formaldehyde dehydrogenase [Streptomyces radicis]RKN27721.1 glutathione-dependent formaldehyde dehydrogenase [Streptomyces radicis]